MRSLFLTSLVILLSNCDNNNDLNDINLEKYLYRTDSFLCSAIKVIPGKGQINWITNTSVEQYRGNYALILSNYSDTSNWQTLVDWAYLRELISIEFDPSKLGKMKLVDRFTYNTDTTLLRAVYIKFIDGGDYDDAYWDIDTTENSFIKINKFDLLNRVVEGEFNLYFKLTTQTKFPDYKYDSLVHFKNGLFKSRIK